KKEKRQDFEEVELLLKVTFEQDTVAKMVDGLRKTENFIPELSLVARISDQIIGVIMYSHIKIIKGRKSFNSIALGPMAVLPAYQNLGIGSELLRTSFEEARNLEYQSVIVMGSEDYYPRFGFIPASDLAIISPFDVPSENFMAKELFPDTLAKVSGKVKFHPLFDDIVSYTI
ncbi:MAG: GNAT family N-acetyltransferase, partial [Bacteroidales bacterium]|nr:GNAT family N-acetyltransferase [Bacteroidales bacterium]